MVPTSLVLRFRLCSLCTHIRLYYIRVCFSIKQILSSFRGILQIFTQFIAGFSRKISVFEEYICLCNVFSISAFYSNNKATGIAYDEMLHSFSRREAVVNTRETVLRIFNRIFT